MSPLSNISNALRAYAEWHNAPPADLWVNSGSTPHTEVIGGESVTCIPDGGMADFVQRHERQLRIERAAQSIHDLVPYLPSQLRQVFDATYVGLPLEVPRMERDAAARLSMGLNKYQKLKFGLLCWFSGCNFQAAQFDIAVPLKGRGK